MTSPKTGTKIRSYAAAAGRWTRYPRPLENGKFHEDLDLIIELLGTHLYHYAEDEKGQVWIKAVQSSG